MPGFSKYVIGGIIVLVSLFFISGWSAYSYASSFDGHIAPNVFVGNIDLGRKTPEDARTILQQHADTFLTRGVEVRYMNHTETLPLSSLIGSDIVEYVQFDIDQTIENALALHHSPNPIGNVGKVLYGLVRPSKTPVIVHVNSEAINTSLHTLFAKDEKIATETSFIIKQTGNAWNVEINQGLAGDQIDEEKFHQNLVYLLTSFTTEQIELTKTDRKPKITEEIALKAKPVAEAVLRAAPYHLVFTHEDGSKDSWKLSASQLSTMLEPTEDGTISLKKDSFVEYLEPITKAINVPAQNARFQIANGRATEFSQSREGYTVDQDTLYKDTIQQITQGSATPIPIATIVQKPDVETSSVNTLGITDVLGVGISNYGKSPKNRRANIQNGVNLLNGLLVAPGDTFSLVSALKPFSADNGYLKELVIKKDKIEPDLGGGLCQIGTTLFRSAMHSGLPIVQRQNHSLWVSYYNDPSNGNPGTDATIFDPAPDFKFQNDTGHYILIQAENIPKKSELRFTIWGVSDGRKGTYTAPVVTKVFPYGDEIIQTTPDLKPGEEKCQEAHKGADAWFTYTITKADGTKTDKVFTSHYRPLPKICLVGVDPNQSTTTSDTNSTPQTTQAPSN